MLDQNPQSALLLRNRFAAWVGILIFIAACTFMFNNSQAELKSEAQIETVNQRQSKETRLDQYLEEINRSGGRFDLEEMIELELKDDFSISKSNTQNLSVPFKNIEDEFVSRKKVKKSSKPH